MFFKICRTIYLWFLKLKYAAVYECCFVPRSFKYQIDIILCNLSPTHRLVLSGSDNFHARMPTAHRPTIVRNQTEVDSTAG